MREVFDTSVVMSELYRLATGTSGGSAVVLHGHIATIDGAAHYPNMERPEEFNAILAEFLCTNG